MHMPASREAKLHHATCPLESHLAGFCPYSRRRPWVNREQGIQRSRFIFDGAPFHTCIIAISSTARWRAPTCTPAARPCVAQLLSRDQSATCTPSQVHPSQPPLPDGAGQRVSKVIPRRVIFRQRVVGEMLSTSAARSRLPSLSRSAPSMAVRSAASTTSARARPPWLAAEYGTLDGAGGRRSSAEMTPL